jgi:hypothetical protein
VSEPSHARSTSPTRGFTGAREDFGLALWCFLEFGLDRLEMVHGHSNNSFQTQIMSDGDRNQASTTGQNNQCS